MFWRQVADHPDRVAVVDSAQHLTYRALGRRARAWTWRLQKAGVGHGDLVGVHLDRSADLVAAMLGVLTAGAAYVPLDPAYPRERLDYMVADAGMAVLVTADPTLAGPRGADVPVIAPGDIPREQPHPTRVAPMHADHLAYVLYTSGSTGAPKGVGITHANAVDLLRWSATMFGVELDRVLASTSVCFDCSILEIFGPLSTGGTTVVGSGPEAVADGSHAAAVRLIHTVPSVVADLLRTGRLPSSVTTAIVGGEALLPAVVERIYSGSAIQRLVNLYGPTEYTSYATAAVVPRSPDDHAVPPIGRPVANTDIHIITEHGLLAGSGTGELAIAGAGLARGYLGKPALTAERFVPEPAGGEPGRRMYRTGDLGHRDADGLLFFLGRVDDQIKHRGVRIEPAEIEQALMAVPGVAEAAVVQADVLGRSVLGAFVAPDRPGGLDGVDLRAHLRASLPSPLVPEVVTELDRLPRTPNGKLDRANLPAVRLPAAAPCASAVDATSSWVPVLARMWAEAIGVAEVDPSADIFDIGGHSLAALRVRGGITALLGEEPPARLLFTTPTVNALAQELDRCYGPPPPAGSPRSVPLPQPTEPGPLSPTQRAVLDWTVERPDAADLLLPLVVRVRGPIGLRALGNALLDLQRRHHILRTVVENEPAAPPRFVRLPRAAAQARLLDLSGLPAALAESTARQVAEEVSTAPMRLSAGPPIRATLIRLGRQDLVLALAIHRIAADAWSVELVSHEILRAYGAAITGEPAVLPEPVHYSDWAAEQRRALASESGRAQLDRWTTRLAGVTPLALTAGARIPGPAEPTRAFAAVPAETLTLVDALARAERATPFMVYAAAYAVLLRVLTGQSDLVIGCPTAGRDHPGLTEVIGPCAESFPLRCDLAAVSTFRGLVGQVRDRAVEAFGDADVPFAVLADRLGAAAGRHPAYQAAIVLQQGQSLLNPNHREDVFGAAAVGGVDIGPFLDQPPGTALDVELMLFPRDRDVEVVLDCRPDAVAPARVASLAEGFAELLGHLCGAPDGGLTSVGAAGDELGGAFNRKT
ncbi:amino acid adenylation domain-containing protein [Actinokineospora guangxiensis]|uniref:Amino acid adenylation domain-containing protein n=1 Tax=Actinokineospora guangxiensis TaxID=1490288 RepID=A0ABW0ERE0_9PSEU